jgi:hypothetical protein
VRAGARSRLGGALVASACAAAVVATAPSGLHRAVAAASSPPSVAAARHAVFDIGAATVNVTPPKPGGPADIADTDCTAVGGSGPFTGKRQFGLEEPYVDSNGNGSYDGPDPTTGKGGEPFLDCPTPTATGGMRPPDGRWDGIYVGGGDCCDRLADGTVLDHLSATAVVVQRGAKRIALVSADNEGVFKEIWDEVRAKVTADGVQLDAVFPSSTHDESAPDTIGITGPAVTTSGVDPFYVEFFVARVANAVEAAAAHLTPSRLRYGSVHATNLVPCWSSYPFTADENVGVLQARSVATGRVVTTLVNYGIHAEELGFDPKTRRVLSGDWWHFLRTALRKRYGGAPVLAMAGPVGSVEMPLILRGPRDRLPAGVHQFSSRDGCTTIYSGPKERVAHEGGYSTYTKTLGQVVAHWASKALHRGATNRSGRLKFAAKTIYPPIDNALFLAAGPACVFDYRILYTDDAPSGTGIPPACGAGNQIATDLGYFKIGEGSFVTAPGELFPFTYDHDFHGHADLPVPSAGPVHGWVTARLGGRWRFVDGLGEDLSGYIFPSNNEVGTPGPSNPNGDNVDRFDCHHVDDAEASSGREGDIVDDALLDMLPRSNRDVVVPGRYVYADGTLHRDPTGDGRLACDSKSANFHRAPHGGAVGVWVLPKGSHRFVKGNGRLYLLRPSRLGKPSHRDRWIDVQGVPQRRPDQQTRGVILPSGRRLWLDVYPTLKGPRKAS